MGPKLYAALALTVGTLVGVASAQAQYRERPAVDSYRGYDNRAVAGPFDNAYDQYGGAMIAPPGASYVYGADRANPSVSPSGLDEDSGRDFQLSGHN